MVLLENNGEIYFNFSIKANLKVLLSIVMLSVFGFASCKTTAPVKTAEAEAIEAENGRC